MALFTNELLRLERRLKEKLTQAGREVEGEMHNLVAIDTGRLDQSIKTDEVVRVGNFFVVQVGSEGVEYAKYVELSKTVKNYHRGRRGKGKDNRQIIFTGQGLNFLGRALRNKQAKIKEILNS